MLLAKGGERKGNKRMEGSGAPLPIYSAPRFPLASYGPGETEWANIGILTRETTKVKQRTFLTFKLVGKHVVFV
jgi:hypothetical protein